MSSILYFLILIPLVVFPPFFFISFGIVPFSLILLSYLVGIYFGIKIPKDSVELIKLGNSGIKRFEIRFKPTHAHVKKFWNARLFLALIFLVADVAYFLLV